MYTLQYWNPSTAKWRNAGFRSVDYTATLRALRDNQRMTDSTVRFRILLPTTHPSHELAWLVEHEYDSAVTNA